MAKKKKSLFEKAVKNCDDLTLFPLKGLSEKDIELYIYLCFKIQEGGANKVTIPLTEVANNLGLCYETNEKLADEIFSMTDRIMSLCFYIDEGDWITLFVLFCEMSIDDDYTTLEVSVNKEFMHLVENTARNFTFEELKAVFSLSSLHSKKIYRKLILCKNDADPSWQVSREDFKEYLELPEDITTCRIKINVIDSAIAELSKYLPCLKCEPMYENDPSTVGRSKVAGYRFSWDNER